MSLKPILATLLLAASGWTAAAAQTAGADALYAQAGLQRAGDHFRYASSDGGAPAVRDLTPDQTLRVEKVVSAPDSADGGKLTDGARKAVLAIVFEEPSAAAAVRVPDWLPSEGPRADPAAATARVRDLLASSSNPNFDGGATVLPDAPVPAGTGFSSSLDGPKPLAPKPASVPKPAATPLEKDLFWSSWWGYHAAWAADFTTTGLILDRGGYEKDHLYTQFGNKNMAGVIGSAAAFHVVASVASLALYKEAQKKHGVWRHALMTAAVGMNLAGVEIHTQAAAGNVGVMQNWNR